MKGNHNKCPDTWSLNLVVFNISKIQNERKSQRAHRSVCQWTSCVQHIKDTKWKEITTSRCIDNCKHLLCSTYQRYKMKGNHNCACVFCLISIVVFNISKIQNETDEGGSRIPIKNYLMIMSKGNHNWLLTVICMSSGGFFCTIFHICTFVHFYHFARHYLYVL